MTERVYAGRTSAERVERRREQFLAAGLEVFAVRGWAGGTVSDVCRFAGLSPRYFYELFGTREDLFIAVTARIMDETEAVVRGAVAASGPGADERARAVLTALADHFAADPRRVRVALVESLATDRFRRHRHDLLTRMSDLASRLMRALRTEPLDRDAQEALQVSAALLTGGLVELLMARATGLQTAPGEPVDLAGHLATVYAAVARA